MEIDEEEINPMDLLSTELGTNNEDPLSTYVDNEDDNDVEEIISEPVIINIDDDNDPPPALNGFNHEPENSSITLRPGQLPDDYSEAERATHLTIFGPGQQGVQFHRLHCTACNTHLGSAPNDQTRRYIHPLLKVLICKSCFDFYGSGDFDKDEDGTELYCRWCGQGGKVLCCAKCPHVFCQKCIRVNLGKKALEMVKQSDDWLCFICNPNQIMKLRITCRALYEYVLKEIKFCEETKQMQFLSLDKSLCCRLKGSTKRKDADASYSPKKKKTKGAATVPGTDDTVNTNAAETWNNATGDEVVCTPDLIMLMSSEEPQTLLECALTNNLETASSPNTPAPADNEIQFVSQTKTVRFNFGNKTTPKNNSKQTSKNKSTKAATSKKKLSKTKITFNDVLGNIKYDWFEKATELSTKVNQNFSTKLNSITNEQRTIQSFEDLAQMHNNFQELLSNSITALMDIQSKLRTDFILGLKKITCDKLEDSNTATPETINNDSNDNNDNDVIVVDFTPSDIPPALSPKPQTRYIKVKPASELLASSVITIHDENPPEFISPTEISSSVPEEAATTSVSTNDVQNDELLEGTDASNPKTATPISRSISENTTLDKNLTLTMNISPEQFKKMTSVRVLLGTDYSNSTIHSCPIKNYSPLRIGKSNNNEVQDQNVSENLLLTSTFINPSKQFASDNTVEPIEVNDPLALDYSLMNDDGNLNNGLTNMHESVIVS